LDISTFYATSSGLCFTLLGFWWVVVQFRHAELTRNAASRRFAFLVALHFAIPGLISLASLLATGALWRFAFGFAGIAGMAAVLVSMRSTGSMPAPVRSLGRAAWLGLPLYGLVTLIAAVPSLPGTLLGMEGLQAEGFVLVLILLLGILLAWFMFTAPLSEGAEERR